MRQLPQPGYWNNSWKVKSMRSSRFHKYDKRKIPESSVEWHPMWFDFLNYLVHEECFNAEQLLNVIEKPWKWKSELTEYVEKGNCPSLQ